MYDVSGMDQHESSDSRDGDDLTVANWMLSVDDISTLVVHDSLGILWHDLSTGETQPVVWPMRLRHRHDQDCGRA